MSGVRAQTVLVATPQVPFVRGGAEVLADALVAALRARGCTADLVTVPFRWYPAGRVLVEQMTAWSLLDLRTAGTRPVDRVIPLKFPAWFARHRDVVPWIFHQHRPAYDLWDTEHGDLHRFPDGEEVRRRIQEADTRALGRCRRRYTLSPTVSERLHRYNGLDSEPLIPPAPDAERFHCGEWGDYVLAPSRLESIKRQERLIRALPGVPDLRVVFTGGGPRRATLERTAHELGVADRVHFAGHVARDALIELYAHCRAVWFAPHDEDLGLVTLEAMAAGKPVLTTDDSGGPLAFVEDGVTGAVLPAEDPDAPADALAALTPARARSWGEAAGEAYRAMDLSWERVTDALTAP